MIRLRIDVAKNPSTGWWSVTQWHFEKRSGRTVFHCCHGTGFTWKEAHELKRELLKSLGN